MLQRDTLDFMMALGIGALVGAGVTLLLRPAPPTPRARLLKKLKPYRKRIRKDRRRAGAGFREGAAASADAGRALGAAGRELAREVRAEFRDLVAEIREEVGRAVARQLAETRQARERPTARA